MTKVNTAREFGFALRGRRKNLGYTHSDLSKFSGLSVSFIFDLERGKKTTELGKTIYIANLLGLDCNISARGEI